MKKAETTKVDLKLAPQVKTANALMMDLETEIQAIKAGELPIDKARVVMQGRRQQIRVIEIAIAVTRLDQAMRPAVREYFLKNAPIAVETELKPEKKLA